MNHEGWHVWHWGNNISVFLSGSFYAWGKGGHFLVVKNVHPVCARCNYSPRGWLDGTSASMYGTSSEVFMGASAMHTALCHIHTGICIAYP